MFEEDYIVRMVRELVRAMLKLVFLIETEEPSADILDEKVQRDLLGELLGLVDEGSISAAEDRLAERLNGNDPENLKVALLFYSYLNGKDDDFLLQNAYSRGQVKSGLETAVDKFGFGQLAELFLRDL